MKEELLVAKLCLAHHGVYGMGNDLNDLSGQARVCDLNLENV